MAFAATHPPRLRIKPPPTNSGFSWHVGLNWRKTPFCQSIYQQLIIRMTKSMLGNGATESIIAEDGNVTLKKYRKHKRRLKRFNKEFKQSKSHLESLHGSCIDHIRPVTSPLVLISQIQRSGGSLLSQLLDGHPELDAHPHELKIG
jgi:hypothetical protein